MKAHIQPAKAEAINLVYKVSTVPVHAFNRSFNSSYGAIIPKFTKPALIIDGKQPLHKEGTPSSLTILYKALNALL